MMSGEWKGGAFEVIGRPLPEDYLLRSLRYRSVVQYTQSRDPIYPLKRNIETPGMNECRAERILHLGFQIALVCPNTRPLDVD